jgi:hypothetical protein
MKRTRKLTDEEFEANVADAVAAVQRDPQSLNRANELLHVVGCTGISCFVAGFDSLRPVDKHKAIVMEALLLGVRTYLSHPPNVDSHLQHAFAGLYELDAWRPLVECRDTLHAAARTLLIMGSYIGHRHSRGLNILNDWLKPTTRFTYTFGQGDLKRLQQEIVPEMFGDAWWMFNGPDLESKFDVNKITEQKPMFRAGLLDVPSEAPAVLPELT